MRALGLLVWTCLPAALHAQSIVHTIAGAAGDGLGRCVVGVGDVDGDGRADYVACATLADGPAADAGGVRLVSGRTGQALWSVFGTATGDDFGWSAAALGDLDGDGAAELIVGAPSNAVPGRTGRVRVHSGRSGALLREHVGGAADDGFGISVAGLGDLDGDGMADYAIGAWQSDASGADAGSVSVHSGASGVRIRLLHGLAADDRFGICVRGLGDADGDGIDDLAVGAHGHDAGGANAGAVFVFAGSDGALRRTFLGLQPDDQFGFALAGAGDLDGDGRADLVVGAREARDAQGRTTGAAYALSTATGAVLFALEGETDGALLGYSVDGGRDVDLDGIPDWVVGAVFDDSFAPHAGAAYVVSGANGALLHKLHGDDAGDGFGRSVAFTDDLSGDGAADVVVGAYRDELGGVASGSVRTFRGFDLQPAAYCSAKVNSRGCTPAMSWSGLPRLSGPDDFRLRATQVLSGNFGLLIHARAPQSLPWLGGTLCVQPPIARTGVQHSGGATPVDCSGTYEWFASHAWMAAQGITAGTSVYCQFYSRDPGYAPPANVGLTDAVAFTVRP